jgi:predicted PurR-regulated permease PerM
VVGGLLLIVPVLQQQLAGLPRLLPDLIRRAQELIMPMVEATMQRLGQGDAGKLPELASANVPAAASAAFGALGGIVSGGMVLFDVLSVVIITPIVSFYLLRDWKRLVDKVDDWLPRASAEVIREQARAVDSTLAAFVRGQALVCLALAVWYGLGLTVIGLDFGVLIGAFIGIIAFVPILGSLVGAALSIGLAFVQFEAWRQPLLVALLFAVGQFGEAYILTPRLIGDRVGLHPVWVIFALLAGGAIAGFLGVLIAVPAAAVIGVLVRFALARYLASPLYREPPISEDRR